MVDGSAREVADIEQRPQQFRFRQNGMRTNRNPGIAVGVPSQHVWTVCSYLSAVETVLNVVFKFVPSACTVAMIATAMPAAMRPYSIAVAADSSRINLPMDLLIDCSCTLFTQPSAVSVAGTQLWRRSPLVGVNLTEKFFLTYRQG